MVAHEAPSQTLEKQENASEPSDAGEVISDDFDSVDTDREAGVNHTEQGQLDDAELQMAEFDAKIPDSRDKQQLRQQFFEALTLHLSQRYSSDSMKSSETEATSRFELTEPEERVYPSSEPYRFLVHVPLGDVAGRASEIGQERGNSKLMTSLISEEHQGTFLGEGGIIVAEPSEGSVSGVASIDVGGEIQAGRNDEIEDIVAPAPPFEYNQIDMAFDGTEPVGVLIKQTPAGQQLGSLERNKSLIAYAKEHDLPVVTVEVQPAELITEATVGIFELSEGQGEMLTIDLPFSDSEFIRSQVLRIGEQNVVYHAGDEDRVARTMRVNQYGESTQEFTKSEVALVVDRLKKLRLENPEQISDEDIKVIADECQRLSQKN